MKAIHWRVALAIAIACCGTARAQDKPNNVTGAFEGWFKNPDGSFSLLLGYFNRTEKQEFDIPVGPDNRIEPGGPDRGQPTHFLTGRQWGMFAVKVAGQSEDLRARVSVVWNSLHEELKELSTRARRIVAKRSSHYVQIDRPDLLNREVPLFIRQVRGEVTGSGYGSTKVE